MTNLSNRTKNFIIVPRVLMMFVFITIFLLFSYSALAEVKTGAPAPEFTLSSTDGKIYQLNQFLNKQQHLILCFVNSDEPATLDKLENMINFFLDYQPRESYQIMVIVKHGQDLESALERLHTLREKEEIPQIILIDEEGKANADYGIEKYPTIFLLRTDLYVRKIYDRFNARQEKSFYQYLSFLFSSQKSKDSNNGCDGGTCPPPPGFE